jgi:hypothetical protein
MPRIDASQDGCGALAAMGSMMFDIVSSRDGETAGIDQHQFDDGSGIGIICCDTVSEKPMNHHHRKVLHALFDHPVSGNVAFKDVERMLEDLGATFDTRSGDRVAVTLNGHTKVFHKAHHGMPKDEIVDIRHFLSACGVDPKQYPI